MFGEDPDTYPGALDLLPEAAELEPECDVYCRILQYIVQTYASAQSEEVVGSSVCSRCTWIL